MNYEQLRQAHLKVSTDLAEAAKNKPSLARINKKYKEEDEHFLQRFDQNLQISEILGVIQRERWHEGSISSELEGKDFYYSLNTTLPIIDANEGFYGAALQDLEIINYKVGMHIHVRVARKLDESRVVYGALFSNSVRTKDFLKGVNNLPNMELAKLRGTEDPLIDQYISYFLYNSYYPSRRYGVESSQLSEDSQTAKTILMAKLFTLEDKMEKDAALPQDIRNVTNTVLAKLPEEFKQEKSLRKLIMVQRFTPPMSATA